MKKCISRYTHLLSALILSAFTIMGCTGLGETGHWAPTPTVDAISTVSYTAPVNGAISIALNTKILAVFTSTMNPLSINTATFALTGGGAAVAGTVDYIGVTATFTPAANLAANTVYTATITTGVQNSAGTALSSNYVWSFTTGTAVDLTVPTVTSTLHANGAINVPLNAKSGATFSEPMDPLTITTTTYTVTTGGTAIAGTVTYSGVTALFTPTSNLAANTVYTCTITTGAKSLEGNALAANYVWSWTTSASLDTTAPTVTGTAHANGAIGIALNAKSGITFSEAMDPLTINTTTYTLSAAGVGVPATVTYSGVNAVLTPISNLAANTLYTVTVTTGATDLAGNPLAANFTISWTTGATADTTPPTVTVTVPANGITGIALNATVSATFSEAMDPLTITNVTYTLSTGGVAVADAVTYSGVTAVFTPTVNLAASTLYTATITTGAKDLAGNALAADFTWTFTTGAAPDTTPPTVLHTVNANGAINVPISTLIDATFSEALNPLTVTNVTFTFTTGGVAVPGLTSYSGVDAIFTPTTMPLLPNTTYVGTIKGGSSGVKDLAGNALAVDYVWSWMTGAIPDTTPPTVTLTNPATLAVGVCMNKTINATFSEAMNPLTVTTATYTLATTAGVSVTGVVVYDTLTNIATFNPTGNLIGTPATNYTATIKGGINGAKDLAGNALVADKVTTFTTDASTCATAPALNAVSPFGGFGGSATITNDGLRTVIHGDVAVYAASPSVTGFHDGGGNVYTLTPDNNGLVTGLIYTLTAPPGSVAGAVALQAHTDAQTAFNSIAPGNLPGGIDMSSLAQCPSCGGAGEGPGALAGRTLPPGIYLSADIPANYDIGKLGRAQSILTLDGGGDANAVWVFQTAAGTGTLTVGVTGPLTPAVPIQVLLINGAKAKNVFWYVPAGATIGTGSTMVGTILADASTTISTTSATLPLVVDTTLCGSAVSLTAAVTMTQAIIYVPNGGATICDAP